VRLQELLKEVACRGIVFELVFEIAFELAECRERLKVVALKGTITDAIRQALGQNKDAILSTMPYVLGGGCTSWKGSRFWVSVYAAIICATCHPPANHSLVEEWVDVSLVNRHAVPYETTPDLKKTIK
jgi:hypothetical protein